MYNDVNDMRFSIQVDISSVQVLVLLASLYFVIFSDCQYHIGLHEPEFFSFALVFSSPGDCSQETFTAVKKTLSQNVSSRGTTPWSFRIDENRLHLL